MDGRSGSVWLVDGAFGMVGEWAFNVVGGRMFDIVGAWTSDVVHG